MNVGLSVTGIVIIVIMVLLACVMWKVTKLLLIPIQILLFLVLLYIGYKLLITPEKIDAISDGVNSEKIQGLVNKASDSAARLVKAEAKNVTEKVKDGAVQAGKDALDAAKAEKPAEQPQEAAADKTEQGKEETK